MLRGSTRAAFFFGVGDRAPLALLAITCMLPACGRSAPGEDADSAFARRRDDPSRALRTSEAAASAPEAEFAYINDLAVDSRGRAYVADGASPRVTVLGPDGRVVRRLGRQGEGPGEFRSVTTLQVLPGDSLLVYDWDLARVSVFAPDAAEPAYVTSLAAANLPLPYWTARAGSGGDLLAAYRTPSRPDEPESAGPPPEVLRLLGPDGKLARDSLYAFPGREALVARSPGFVGRANHPMGRQTLLRVAGGRLYSVRTDSARVEVLGPDGARQAGFRVSLPPVPVTRSELDSVAGTLRNTFQSVLREKAPRQWPAVRGMAVDEQGRVWLGLAAPAGTPVEWAGFTPEGRYVGSFTLPYGAEVKAVRGGRAYAVQKNELDVPVVRIFQVSAPSGTGPA